MSSGTDPVRAEQLLEKLLLVTLAEMKVPQNAIAKFMGRRAEWVNAQLRLLMRQR
jgi:hypothetical protein